MDDFSFAYMQEAFVATLLVLARSQEHEEEPVNDINGDEGPEQYEFYRAMKSQVKILRDDMGNISTPAILPAALPSYEQSNGARQQVFQIGGRRSLAECAQSLHTERVDA
jgi:hypothetical protein